MSKAVYSNVQDPPQDQSTCHPECWSLYLPFKLESHGKISWAFMADGFCVRKHSTISLTWALGLHNLASPHPISLPPACLLHQEGNAWMTSDPGSCLITSHVSKWDTTVCHHCYFDFFTLLVHLCGHHVWNSATNQFQFLALFGFFSPLRWPRTMCY